MSRSKASTPSMGDPITTEEATGCRCTAETTPLKTIVTAEHATAHLTSELGQNWSFFFKHKSNECVSEVLNNHADNINRFIIRSSSICQQRRSRADAADPCRRNTLSMFSLSNQNNITEDKTHFYRYNTRVFLLLRTTSTAAPRTITLKTVRATHMLNRGDRPVAIVSPVSGLIFGSMFEIPLCVIVGNVDQIQ